jgi:NADP-dependent 3-hydroxy acid dehydrogenase YdfG
VRGGDRSRFSLRFGTLRRWRIEQHEANELRLKDRVAVVTGAASGIGKEIARTFARAGAKLAIADLDLAGAELTPRKSTARAERRSRSAMDVTN